jgi:hypothetical protein
VDDEDIDFVAIVTSCCLASEADSKAEGSGYLHLDLIMDIVRRYRKLGKDPSIASNYRSCIRPHAHCTQTLAIAFDVVSVCVTTLHM